MTKAYVIAHPKVTDMEKFGSDFASKVDATLVPLNHLTFPFILILFSFFLV